MMTIQCDIERFDRRGTQWQESATVDELMLPAIVTRERNAWSATLRFHGDDQELALSLNAGSAAILLIAGEDEFYDLVGNESSSGWVEFVHGGQPADHPKRHVLSVDEAIGVASDFLKSRRITPVAPKWERQGLSQK